MNIKTVETYALMSNGEKLHFDTHQVGEYGSFGYESGPDYDRYWEMIDQGYSLLDWQYITIDRILGYTPGITSRR